MDVIALPSTNEPFGITVVEAMAMGKPVVAGRSGGPSEIVTSGLNGVLVAQAAEAVAGGILDCLSQPDFSLRIGAAARERAAQFSSRRYAQEVSRAVRELARRSTPLPSASRKNLCCITPESWSSGSNR